MMHRTPDCCAVLNERMLLDKLLECGLQCIG